MSWAMSLTPLPPPPGKVHLWCTFFALPAMNGPLPAELQFWENTDLCQSLVSRSKLLSLAIKLICSITTSDWKYLQNFIRHGQSLFGHYLSDNLQLWINCFYCMFCVAGFCICPKRWSCFPCGQWISCTAVSCLGCRYLLFFRFYILLIVKTDLLTVQVVWSRWLDISLVIFCIFYSVTSTNKNAKRNLADIQLSWPHTWSIMILSFLQMTARALPYLEEDERLLPKLTNLRFVLLAQCNAITLSGEFCCLVCDDLLVFHYNVFNI